MVSPSSEQENGAEVVAERLCVLKFGSSVLERQEDYRPRRQEMYRHVRDGEKIVAVVSALAGETDSLLAQAGRVGGEGAPGAGRPAGAGRENCVRRRCWRWP